MKKKLPITKNKDVVVSWVYTWSKQQDMSIHEQRIVLRILEACLLLIMLPYLFAFKFSTKIAIFQ